MDDSILQFKRIFSKELKMSIISADTCSRPPRDLSDLLKDPTRPLTPEEEERFDEYMSFKNHSESAADVSLTDTVDEVLSDIDYYLGFKRERAAGNE